MATLTAPAGAPADELRKVQVWFGQTAIATHVATPDAAARYAAAMDRRFPGLPITNVSVPLLSGDARPRPAALLWPDGLHEGEQS